jgi:hypothetical protein
VEIDMKGGVEKNCIYRRKRERRKKSKWQPYWVYFANVNIGVETWGKIQLALKYWQSSEGCGNNMGSYCGQNSAFRKLLTREV